ncbi:MAG: hypothetical protein RL181_2690 [Bacteroidota bacterium]|jgi:ABC-type nickel/cobalt efflux system permease component RcnA
MTNALPILFAAAVGFGHAFELDHLLAVGNMATRRKTIREAVRDGAYWGLGHTSTILIIGAIILLARVGIAERTFQFFEAGVGVMLVALGLHRIWKRQSEKKKEEHEHPHPHAARHLAYGVGLTHGLAGSGALILLVMTEIKDTLPAVLYLLVFGAGSIAGMMLASGIFSLPFSRNFAQAGAWRWRLTLLSSLLCIFFGGKIIFENLVAS